VENEREYSGPRAVQTSFSGKNNVPTNIVLSGGKVHFIREGKQPPGGLKVVEGEKRKKMMLNSYKG